jgi:uncharacterized Zn-finger protein
LHSNVQPASKPRRKVQRKPQFNRETKEKPRKIPPNFIKQLPSDIAEELEGTKPDPAAIEQENLERFRRNCKFCSKVFSTHNIRKKHEKNVHMSEFNCEKCSKKFKSNTALQTHLLIHAGIRNYKCSICEKGFASNSVRLKHEQNVKLFPFLI